MTERQWSALSLGVCVSLGIYAAWLRLPHLFDSLWVDELHTAWIVNGAWSELIARSTIGNQSPFYFAMLKVWSSICGDGEVVLRSPSLLAGLLLVGSMTWWIRRTTGSWTLAMLVAFLAAVDRRLIFYATEARPYAAVQLLAFWLIVITVKLAVGDFKSATTKLRWTAAWFVAAVMLFHLHYTTLLFTGTLLLTLAFVQVRRAAWRDMAAAIFLGIGLLVAIAPSWSHLSQIGARSQLWRNMGSAGGAGEILQLLDVHLYLAPAFGVAIAAILFSSAAALRFRSPSEIREAISTHSIWLAAAVAPTALAWLMASAKQAPLFHSRYVIASAPAVIATGALILQPLRDRWRVTGCLVVLLLVLGSTGRPARYFVPGQAILDRREDWRAANRLALQRARTFEAPVMVRAGLLESASYLDRAGGPDKELLAYLSFPFLADYPEPIEANIRQRVFPLAAHRRRPLLDEAVARIATSRGVVFLYRGDAKNAAEVARRAIEQLGGEWRLVERRRCGSVQLIVAARRRQP